MIILELHTTGDIFQLIVDQKKSFSDVLSYEEAKSLFKDNDILVSPKRYYPFYTIESHYTHTKGGYKEIHQRDLHVLRLVIKKLYNDYSESLEIVLGRNYYHSGSLFLMKKSIYDRYCEFI